MPDRRSSAASLARRVAPLAAVAGALAANGCTSDISVAGNAKCDGQLQAVEGTLDQPFDHDADGYFDGDNPDCVEAYDASRLDCADAEPEVNPGKAEVACNGIDDDCDEATPDHLDADGDGADSCSDCNDADPAISPLVTETTCNGIDDDCTLDTPDALDFDGDLATSCEDCDDSDALSFPGAEEICDDGIDQDCDGTPDDGCVIEYSDTWDLDQTVSYTCAIGNVNIHFDAVYVEQDEGTVSFTAIGTGNQPGTMEGSLVEDAFETEHSLLGGCDEFYTLVGTFTGPETFEAVFGADFVGGGLNCLDCSARSWNVVGTRQP